MIDQQLLDILRCPHDHSKLSVADDSLVERVNRAVRNNCAVNLAGQKLSRELDSGLLRQGGDLLYPVIDAIPVLLPDEALDVSQFDGA